MTNTSKFIVFEGLDGSGKSTQALLLAEAMSRSGIDVVQTRNPGGCAESEAIRNIVFDDRLKFSGISEAYLMVAAVNENMARFRNAEQWVICDRYTWSTIAYQCAGCGIFDHVVDKIIFLTCPIVPDLVIVLDVPPDVSTERTSSRANGNRYDRADQEFLARVRQSFLDQHEASPWNSVVIDGSNPQNFVHQAVMAAVRNLA